MLRKIFLTLFLLTVTITVALGLTPLSAKIENAHRGLPNTLDFSPDGKIFASGSYTDDMVYIWNVSTKERLSFFVQLDVRDIDFSPDGEIIAACGSDPNLISLHDTASGETTALLEGHTETVTSISFSPDGGMIASGAKDSVVKLWSVPDGNLIANLVGHKDERGAGIIDVDFSPDGKYLLSAAIDGTSSLTLLLWDVEQRKVIGTFLNDKAGNKVPVEKGIGFTPGGDVMAPWNEEIQLLSVPNLEVIGTIVEGIDSTDTIALSADGTIIAVMPSFKDTRVFDVATKQELSNMGNDARSIAISPNGKTLATADWSGTISFWKVPPAAGGNNPPDTPPGEEEHAVSPDGKLPTTWGYVKIH